LNLRADVTTEELKIFLVELEEQVQAFEEGLLQLEKEPEDTDLISQVFRCAHTLKGSSSTVGHEKISLITHAMENLLDKLRKKELKLTREHITTLLDGLDILKLLKLNLESEEEGEFPIESYTETVDGMCLVEHERVFISKDELRRITQERKGVTVYEIRALLSASCEEPRTRVFQMLSYLSDLGEIYRSKPTLEEAEIGDLASEIRVILITRKDKGAVSDLLALIPEMERVEMSALARDVEKEEPAARAAKGAKAPEGKVEAPKAPSSVISVGGKSIRIDVRRLDMFMDLLGELVIDRTRLIQLGMDLEGRYEGDPTVLSLVQTFEHLDRITTELHEQIMKTRLLPIGVLFNKFPRMVRDLSIKSGKKINFVIHGEETELDRQIIDQIVDPLTHILRNSIDHGIEAPGDRARAGKSEEGTIVLGARHRENQIVITVEDDGAGIDIEGIKERAVALGLVPRSALEIMSEREILNLIFLPGFSTRETANEVSGRGVGMDIVRSNIERLSGSIIIDTSWRTGTKITIRLPLTLSIVKSLLVTVGGNIYAFHLFSIIEALYLKRESLRTVRGRETINLRGETIPVFNLRDLFRLDERNDAAEDRWVVVVSLADEKAGFVVDSLIGDQEIVIKPLSCLIGKVHGVSGAAILGSGEIALILDVSGLFKLIMDDAIAV
jgi:two-component system chemotaxis sensor kinase CheA